LDEKELKKIKKEKTKTKMWMEGTTASSSSADLGGGGGGGSPSTPPAISSTSAAAGRLLKTFLRPEDVSCFVRPPRPCFFFFFFFFSVRF
jgi:hypothetical protein